MQRQRRRSRQQVTLINSIKFESHRRGGRANGGSVNWKRQNPPTHGQTGESISVRVQNAGEQGPGEFYRGEPVHVWCEAEDARVLAD